MIPDSIKKFRPKNTEIHAKNGHYYVYEVKAFYDKETGKSKRRSLGCIGQIYEGVGFVSNKRKKTEDVTVQVKEYGATYLLYSLTQDVKNTLRSYFGFNGLRIYAAAILKLLPNFSFFDLHHHYMRSYISEYIPKLDFSYESVVNMLEDFGGKSWSRTMLFKEIAGDYWNKDAVVFCRTLFLKDRNAKLGTEKIPCIAKNRILYAYDRDTKTVVFYRTIPIEMSVSECFRDIEARLERPNDTLVFEPSAYSGKEIEEISESGCRFIMPAAKNLIPENVSWDGGFRCDNSEVLYRELPYGKGTKLCIFFDAAARLRLLAQYLNVHNIEMPEDGSMPELDEETATRTKDYGYSVFIVSQDLKPEDIYNDSKVRSQFKSLYQNMNVCPEIDMERESKWRICEGWSFLNYIVYVLYFKVLAALNASGLSGYTIRNLISMGETVCKCRLDDVWHTTNLDDDKKAVFEKLGIPIS